MSALHHDKLKCSIRRIEYDFRSRAGQLFMEKDNCCDAYGCVALFQRIDKRVRLIETYAGELPDMVFSRIDGQWESLDRRRVAYRENRDSRASGARERGVKNVAQPTHASQDGTDRRTYVCWRGYVR